MFASRQLSKVLSLTGLFQNQVRMSSHCISTSYSDLSVCRYMHRGSLFKVLRKREGRCVYSLPLSTPTVCTLQCGPATRHFFQIERVSCVVFRLLEPKLQRSIATSVARGMAHLHTRSPPILHLVGSTCP